MNNAPAGFRASTLHTHRGSVIPRRICCTLLRDWLRLGHEAVLVVHLQGRRAQGRSSMVSACTRTWCTFKKGLSGSRRCWATAMQDTSLHVTPCLLAHFIGPASLQQFNVKLRVIPCAPMPAMTICCVGCCMPQLAAAPSAILTRCPEALPATSLLSLTFWHCIASLHCYPLFTISPVDPLHLDAWRSRRGLSSHLELVPESMDKGIVPC